MANVLLVDDESAITSLYQIALTRSGHHVLTADNGSSALGMGLDSNAPIDVLITDWQMPGLTEDALARRLLSALPHLAMILVSGYDEGPEINPTRVLFLRKPFSPSLLQEKILALCPPDHVADCLAS